MNCKISSRRKILISWYFWLILFFCWPVKILEIWVFPLHLSALLQQPLFKLYGCWQTNAMEEASYPWLSGQSLLLQCCAFALRVFRECCLMSYPLDCARVSSYPCNSTLIHSEKTISSQLVLQIVYRLISQIMLVCFQKNITIKKVTYFVFAS